MEQQKVEIRNEIFHGLFNKEVKKKINIRDWVWDKTMWWNCINCTGLSIIESPWWITQHNEFQKHNNHYYNSEHYHHSYGRRLSNPQTLSL